MRTQHPANELLGPVGLVLLGLVLWMLFGALEAWPQRQSWEYFPSGALGGVLLGIVGLLLIGQLTRLLTLEDLLDRTPGGLADRLDAVLPHGSHARGQATETHGEGGGEVRGEGLRDGDRAVLP